MKRSTHFLALLSIILFAFIVTGRNVNASVAVSSGSGSSSSPYVLQFSNTYYDYTSAGYGNSFSITSGKYYSITPSYGGIITITVNNTYHYWKQSGDSGSTYSTKTTQHKVTAGTTYIFQTFSTTTATIYYHVHNPRSSYATSQYVKDSAEKCHQQSTCSCGDSNYTYSAAPVAHVWENAVIAPTCTSQGYTIQTCKNCGYEQKVDYKDALGHDYSVYTGNKNSSQHEMRCSRCSDTTYVSHTYTVSGTVSTCSVCAYSYDTASSSGSSGSSGSNSGSSGYYSYQPAVIPGTIAVTKLDKKRASITVSVPTDAQCTEVYLNNKLIKTVTYRTVFQYSKKAATTGKYKTRSVFYVNGVKTYSSYSKTVKAAKNVKNYPGAGSYKAKNLGMYGNSIHKTSQLSFSGKKLKVTGYVYNNRMFKLKKVRIHYYLIVNGKKYKKTITKTVNISPYGKKKVTYYIGSGISDIRNAITYKSVSTEGNWGFGWQ